MTYKSLLTIFLSSLGLIGVSTPLVAAQELPDCYFIDNSGKLTDLTDICDVSKKQSPQSTSVGNEPESIVKRNKPKLLNTGFPLDNTVYILGESTLTSDSGLIDSSYYIDNEIGSNYTAYIRRYKTSPTSLTRQTQREKAFQLNTVDSTPDRLTLILRGGRALPFIIYRY